MPTRILLTVVAYGGLAADDLEAKTARARHLCYAVRVIASPETSRHHRIRYTAKKDLDDVKVDPQ